MGGDGPNAKKSEQIKAGDPTVDNSANDAGQKNPDLLRIVGGPAVDIARVLGCSAIDKTLASSILPAVDVIDSGKAASATPALGSIDLGLSGTLILAAGDPNATPGWFRSVGDAAWGSANTLLNAGIAAGVGLGAHDVWALFTNRPTWTPKLVKGVGAFVDWTRSPEARPAIQMNSAVNSFELGIRGDQQMFNRYRGFTPVTAAQWGEIANALESHLNGGAMPNNPAAKDRLQRYVAYCKDVAAGTSPLPARSPRAELQLRIPAPTASPRLRSILGPIAVAAGLGAEPTSVDAATASQAVANAASEPGTNRRTGAELEGHQTVVRPDGVSTVTDSEAQRAEMRRIGPRDIATMEADRARLAPSNNPADKAAGEQLELTLNALGGSRGPSVQAAAERAIAEEHASIVAGEGKFRSGGQVILGVAMITAAALGAYRYWSSSDRPDNTSTESERAKIGGH